MIRLYLVRHGKIAASESDLDPGLTDTGRAQAEAMAAVLAPKGPLPLLTSPFRRTRETAAPLDRLWGVPIQTDSRIGEIPLPPGVSMSRAEWLKFVRQRRWPELDPPLHLWRDQVLAALLEIARDTVVVTHFVAINVTVGHALRDDRVSCFQPENGSCTVLDSDGTDFHLIELGAEGKTPAR